MIKQISNILSLAYSSPASLPGLLTGQLQSKLSPAFTGKKTASPVKGINFEFDFDYSPQVKKMYFNLYEPFVVSALKNILQKGDIFLDVGSNIGFLSAVAAGLVGKTGRVYCFEPSPREYSKLECLRDLNPGYRIHCSNLACGDKNSVLKMDVSRLYGWNTLVKDFMRTDVYESTIDVDVIRLDDFIFENITDIEKIRLIKIDVEGFEYFVLNGLENLFCKTKPLIVCEITPRGNSLLNISLGQIDELMTRHGYTAFNLKNPKKALFLRDLKTQEDILFTPGSAPSPR